MEAAAGACHVGLVVLNEQWLIALRFGGNTANLRGAPSMPSFSLQMSLRRHSRSLSSRPQRLSASSPRLGRGEVKWEGTCCQLWLSDFFFFFIIIKRRAPSSGWGLQRYCFPPDCLNLRLLGRSCIAGYLLRQTLKQVLFVRPSGQSPCQWPCVCLAEYWEPSMKRSDAV